MCVCMCVHALRRPSTHHPLTLSICRSRKHAFSRTRKKKTGYGPTDGRTDGRMDGRTDGQTLTKRCEDASKKLFFILTVMRDAFTVTPVLHKVNASKYQRCAASRKHFTVGSFAESLYCIGSKLQTNEPKSTHTLFFWSLVPLMKHQRSENKITMVFFLAPP